MEKLKVVAIIPAYNPDEKMLKTIEDLKAIGFEQIVVVNDGSKEQSAYIFSEAQNKYGCRILTHAVNQGQGRSLKTAFNDFLNQYPDYIGAVTLDADGQHAAEDAYQCAKVLVEDPSCLVMGCRNFSEDHVPFKSRMGNLITRNVFRFLCGIKISDTQTGLRALSGELMKHLIGASGERYEFCSSILMEAKKMDIPIREVAIQTIYIDGNKSSHFNPLRDSARIYALIFLFLLSSLSSFIVDMVFFTLILSFTAQFSLVFNTLIATYSARLCSSVFNYKVNRNLVFKKGQHHSLYKYIVICVIQATLSYLGVFGFSNWLNISPVWVKVVIDMLLFLISFQIQREWVFKSTRKK